MKTLLQEPLLPKNDSPEGLYYLSIGVRCFEFPVPWALPNVANAFLAYAHINWQKIGKIFSAGQYDIVVSNTITILHGNIVAALIGVPHVTYVHEILDDPEFLPRSISRSRYIDLIEQDAQGLMACSSAAMNQFSSAHHQSRLVLVPFDFSQHAQERGGVSGEWVVQVIGNQNYRKNVSFAVRAVKSLNLKGYRVRLDIIGSRGNASAQIERVLQKTQIQYRVFSRQSDPYSINIHEKVITLVCAQAEAYGLTIPESLRLGVPVVSSNCGGPEEILMSARRYPVNDLDVCVRSLVSVFENYDESCRDAQSHYQFLRQKSPQNTDAQRLDSFINSVSCAGRSEAPAILNLLQCVSAAIYIPVGISELIKNLELVSQSEGIDLSAVEFEQKLNAERLCPGKALHDDVSRYNVIPFGMSRFMDQLYREGLGLAVDLVATFQGVERLKMVSFIICALWQQQQVLGRPVRVLALGDGAGIDSIRIANAGFSVDYIDYDQSNMAKFASLNFASAQSGNEGRFHVKVMAKIETVYDAVVCLEVIEHVPDPLEFIGMLATSVEPDGVVFISDCFNGLEDRWPTHLWTNERYAGMLPFMMNERFELIDVNNDPFAKPYMFRRRASGEVGSVTELLQNRELLSSLIRNQLDIGI